MSQLQYIYLSILQLRTLTMHKASNSNSYDYLIAYYKKHILPHILSYYIYNADLYIANQEDNTQY